MWLRQSTASQEVLLGPFLDSTDGSTAEVGLTIANTDIKIWKEGGTTEASKNSGGATHIASGRYYAVLDATDTDTLGKLEINVHVTGALPVRRQFMVLPAMVYDSLVLGTDVFQADVTQFGGTNGTFSSGRPEVNTTHWAGTAVASATVRADLINIAGAAVSTTTAQLGVNVVQISGDSVAADNLEAAADGTGYNLGGGAVVAASVTGAVGSVTGNVGGNVVGSVASVTGAVGSVTGAVGSVTGNVGGNVVGSVASVTGAVGSVTGNVGGNVTGSVGSVATGGITSGSFAAGAIDAAAIAANAIGASELAADAVAEIQSGLSTLDAAGVRTAVGLASANLDTQLSGIQTDTNDIQTRLPAALVSGRMDASVGAVNNSTAAAARLALSAGTIIPATVDTVTNGHTPTVTEFQADDVTEATADHYNGRVVIFTSGNLIGQATAISDYANVGGIGQFTVVALTEAPANNDTFIII